MKLKNLLNCQKKFEEMEIAGISRDSKTIQKDEVFFCLTDDYEKTLSRCQEALDGGAAFVVSNFNLPFEKSLKVENCRKSFAAACKVQSGNACDKMKMIGVTGTNGKTTTSYIIAQMLSRNGHKVGLIGTNGVYYDGKREECPLTTPDADFLHETFKKMHDAGVEFVVMEVSAHAVDQDRIHGINFDIGVLTNITQDHLDYFKTMKNYQNAKEKFFENVKSAVICTDDVRCFEIAQKLDIPVTTYGIENPCDAFAIDVFCSLNGSRFVANINDEIMEIKTNLIGDYNIYNSLAALCVCQKLGLNAEALKRGLNFISPVEGRFNVINLDGKYIVIDYAHTPDGLEKVLQTARKLTDGKVFVVFGCGGNRDKDKRHKMGKIAEENADYVCLTDDNPRYENPAEIIKEIEKGMKKTHFVEKDRQKAIEKMLTLAKEKDIIVVAGKGAEKYQEIQGVKHPYNDFDAVYNIFKPKIKKDKFYGC